MVAARMAKMSTWQLPMTTAKLMSLRLLLLMTAKPRVTRAALPRLPAVMPMAVTTRLKVMPLPLVTTSRRELRRPSPMMAMPVEEAKRLMMTSAALPRLKVAMQRAAPTRLKLMSLAMVMSRRAPMRPSPVMAYGLGHRCEQHA